MQPSHNNYLYGGFPVTGITVTFSDWSRAESVLSMILGTDWIFESYFQTLDLTFDIIIILLVGTKSIETLSRYLLIQAKLFEMKISRYVISVSSK